MKNSGAIFLILAGLFGLYLYNTGRAAAILQVLKDPAAPRPGQGGVAPGLPGNPGGGGGGFNSLPGLATCGNLANPACIGAIFDAVQDPFDALKDIGNIFTAPFGIRL